MNWFKQTCKACEGNEAQIKYLKDSIDYLKAEWKAERDEYKRAVDRLLELAGSRAVGQGETKPYNPVPIDPGSFVNMFRELEEVDK